MENLKASEAQQVISAKLSSFPAPGVETVGIECALGRVLAQDVFANRDLPPFAVSAMDGFALRAVDIVSVPATLAVIEDINAGQLPQRTLGSGQCARIMTGAPLPAGADCVIKVEDTFDESAERVTIGISAPAGNFVRPRGESMRLGDAVLAAGTSVSAGVVGILATVKAARVDVYRRPRVAILSTGDELEGLGEAVDANKIPDSNSYALMAQVQSLGIEPTLLGIARDDPAELEALMRCGLEHDVLLVSGGSSAGVHDFVRSSIARLGVDIAFWRVATRPGHPLAFGSKGRTVFFGVPGYPVSSMVCMEQFVLPTLRRLMGQTRVFRRTLRARLAAPFKANPGRTEFVRVQLAHDGAEWLASPTGSQSSVVLLSMARADGFMVVPAECPGLAVGDEVCVQLFDSAALQETMGFVE